VNHSRRFAIFTASVAVLSISTILVADDKAVQDEIKRLKQEQAEVQTKIRLKVEEVNEALKQKGYIDTEFDKIQAEVRNTKKQFVTQSQILDVIKLKIITLTARSIKIEKEVERISKQEDPITQTLQKIVEIDQAELSRGKKLYDKGNVGNQELSEMQRKALESTLALQKYRSGLTDEPRRRMHLVRDAIEDADLESKMQEIHLDRAKSEYDAAQQELKDALAISEKPAELDKQQKELEKKFDEISEKLKKLEAKP